MTKLQFILALRNRLDAHPKEDWEQALEYYNELIDDRMEDGISEEEAVAAIGSVDTIAEQLLSDHPLPKPVTKKAEQTRPKAGVIILLIAGAPVWLSLLACALAIVICLYAGVFSVVVSLFATSVALGICAPMILLLGIQALVTSGIAIGLVYWGLALVCAGLSVFLWIGGHYCIKSCIWISKKCWLWMKSLFLRKEVAQ